jgi:cytochrome b pre-mRNA-processing protein 3
MLGFLFPRLTPTEPRGHALFAAAVTEARKPFWYVELGVPDTLDGRFSVLATVTALISIRLERSSEDQRAASVALTERFVEAMDAEHSQHGLGDPTLGKVVRKLVGALSRRIDLWRAAAAGGDWEEAARDSLEPAEGGQAMAGSRVVALKRFWARLQQAADRDLVEGRF